MTRRYSWFRRAEAPTPQPNPLAVGFYCPTCGARLDKADRPCPLGCSGRAA